MPCLFCAIAAGTAPADVTYEDDDIIAFHDIHPKYPVHMLIIPKTHIASAAGVPKEHDWLLGKLLRVGAQIAKEKGIVESGFRLLANTGPDSGQVVEHLHVHLVGGEPLRPL